MDFNSLAAYNPQSDVPRPYVKFELRSVEDRTIISSDGTSQVKDVAFAIVRAPGAKDALDKPAHEWLAQLKTYAKDERVPRSWPIEYAEAFALWEKGQEIPLHGTAIKTWPPLSPAQRKNTLDAGILTVEDLAVANEEVRGKIGMGALALQTMAQKWLEESKSLGATALALKNAQIEMEELKVTLKNQSVQIAQLLAKVDPKG